MKHLWKFMAAAAVAAALFTFVIVQQAQAVSYVGGLDCSPLSGSGANNTSTCKIFGDMATYHPQAAGMCSITLTFTSDPWSIVEQPKLMPDGKYTKDFNVTSGTQAKPIQFNKCGSHNDTGSNDGRANGGHGDHVAAIYNDSDEHGKADLKLYCITADGGYYGGEISQALLDAAPFSTANMTLVKKFTDCRYPVSLYRLYTGEFQLSFGPDGEGNTASMVFTGLPPTDVHYYDTHPGDTH